MIAVHLTDVGQSNSKFPLTWSSTAVAALFDASVDNSSMPSASSSAPPSSLDMDSNKHKRVVIGVPIGVVAAVALLGLGVFIFRHKVQRQAKSTVRVSSFEKPRGVQTCSEMPASERPSELVDPRAWLEMPAKENPSELPDPRACLEMPASGSPVEMAVNQRR